MRCGLLNPIMRTGRLVRDAAFRPHGYLMPLQLDPTQRVVNIHWASGLAVEFFDEAGGRRIGVPERQDESSAIEQRTSSQYVEGNHLFVVQGRKI